MSAKLDPKSIKGNKFLFNSIHKWAFCLLPYD
jgi:hypothetical protein